MNALSATIWALIPVKARGQGKTRLAGQLCAEQRDKLVEAMFEHVVQVANETVERTVVVGPQRSGVSVNLDRIEEPGGGLNAALGHALTVIARKPDAPSRLIVIAADLPCITPNDIARLAELPLGIVGIAPDRHGSGTNALSLPLPQAAGFRFHYGTDSASLHRNAAQSLGLSAVTIITDGLAKDIDEPFDLADAAHLFSFMT
ncbi:2-phospho-L-lactate guanylyltransferase [Novosphingobium barchaimii LL02]|uniref:2-phospho-L-lactate guanylyltransferase n=1 Tax=Novosphingobium barchaimii LL02 TaxID=1114963 RepID=A0A0J7Y5J9_9SPHN|nr:2-phospho-L-lactate guanylyltransferase [Novosphingobium barchaimii]KMS59174.1 2-phospho-L-lactate guanylyltransferase [Novosphingobium barchaimii LL02]